MPAYTNCNVTQEISDDSMHSLPAACRHIISIIWPLRKKKKVKFGNSKKKNYNTTDEHDPHAPLSPIDLDFLLQNDAPLNDVQRSTEERYIKLWRYHI